MDRRIEELLTAWSKKRDPEIWAIISDLVEEQVGHQQKAEVLDDLKIAVDQQARREQVAIVVGEELEEEPWMVQELTEEEPVQPIGRPIDVDRRALWPGRKGRRWLWYDAAPEWAARELGAGSFRTIVTDGGGYQSAEPEFLQDAEGGIWERVRDYQHGAERECPYLEAAQNYSQRHEETVELGDTYFGEHPGKECRFCGEKLGDKHRYVYIGEGAEYVYRLLADEEE